MGHREPQADDFVWLSRPKDEVYDGWLREIAKLEESSRSASADDQLAAENVLEIGFRLFPIIDSISFNFLGAKGTRYLQQLGYTKLEADLIFRIFRNGQLHNTQSYRLVYEDGEIWWGMSGAAGSGYWRPHVEGVDKPFVYEWDAQEEVGRAYLRLSGLAAQVRSDLEKRKLTDDRDKVPFIVGREYKRKIPQRLRITSSSG